MSPFPGNFEIEAIQFKTWEPFVSVFSTYKHRRTRLSKSRGIAIWRKSLVVSELFILVVSKTQPCPVVRSEKWIQMMLMHSPYSNLIWTGSCTSICSLRANHHNLVILRKMYWGWRKTSLDAIDWVVPFLGINPKEIFQLVCKDR